MAIRRCQGLLSAAGLSLTLAVPLPSEVFAGESPQEIRKALVGLAAASLAPNDAPPLSLSQHGAVMKRRSTAEIKSAGRPYVDLPEQET